mgnify:FL=1
MRIDGAGNCGPRDVAKGGPASGKPAGSPTDAPAANQAADANGGVKSYTAEALSADEVNAAAVAEARRLLATGALDSPQAIQRAAEAIINYGP